MNGKIEKLVFCLFLLIPCSGFTQRVMTLSELMTDMQNRREHYICLLYTSDAADD